MRVGREDVYEVALARLSRVVRSEHASMRMYRSGRVEASAVVAVFLSGGELSAYNRNYAACNPFVDRVALMTVGEVRRSGELA